MNEGRREGGREGREGGKGGREGRREGVGGRGKANEERRKEEGGREDVLGIRYEMLPHCSSDTNDVPHCPSNDTCHNVTHNSPFLLRGGDI